MCKENCKDPESDLLDEYLNLSLDNIYINENLDLCSIKDFKKGQSLSKLIKDLDKVVCDLKLNNINSIYTDLKVDSFITKELICDNSGKCEIKLSINKNLLCDVVSQCSISNIPFIITSNRNLICGVNVAILSSGYPNTVWYNSNNIEIGTGLTISINSSGAYYAKSGNQISNTLFITKSLNCPEYNFTKFKNFYKSCPNTSTSVAYSFSKIYTSFISESDAKYLADVDDVNFNNLGQTEANLYGSCINNPQTQSNCFTALLNNPVFLTIVPLCFINFTITSIQCL